MKFDNGLCYFRTMKEICAGTEGTTHYLVHDKVRQGEPVWGGRMGVLFYSNDTSPNNVAALVRYKMVDVVPADWDSLKLMPEGRNICIPFSLSSYGNGAGKIVLNKLKTFVGDARVITLSPRDDRVTNFHLGNGAEIYAESVGFRNFKYK